MKSGFLLLLPLSRAAPRSLYRLAVRRLALYPVLVAALARMSAIALVLGLLQGCAAATFRQAGLSDLSPLQVNGVSLSVDDVSQRITSPDLLALDDEMRAFVQLYTEDITRKRARMMSLHRAMRGAALGIEYDPAAEGSASQVFHRGSANCLSYATLFIALAREAGLDAEYQWLRVRPQWSKRGERVMVRVHVNALVNTSRRERFMIDIDPLPTREIAGAEPLSDDDALALYHANIAMYLLAEGDTEDAWLHSVRALQLSPSMAQLWVNIGAVYRFAGQHRDAERSYFSALDLDPGNDSAMNNLVVLYDLEGRDEERALWEVKVESYRDRNPYYHAWLGDRAADEGEWGQAKNHYEKALKLSPEDSRLLYALGNTHLELDEPQLASAYIRQAIEHAKLRSVIDAYELKLKALEEGATAGT